MEFNFWLSLLAHTAYTVHTTIQISRTRGHNCGGWRPDYWRDTDRSSHTAFRHTYSLAVDNRARRVGSENQTES